MVAEVSSSQTLYRKLRDHGSGLRTDAFLVLLETVKNANPDHHVTHIDSGQMDLQGFADAGHAEVTPETADGDWAWHTSYQPGNKRLSKHEGTFTDSYMFARFSCRWKGTDYTVYKAKWLLGAQAQTANYVLSPRQGQTITANDHSPLSDAFIGALIAWSVALHGEVYVYDNNWRKDKDLYKTIEKSSWDEVILDPATKDNVVNDVRSFFESKSLYDEFNVPWKRGIILHGSPGNGKTMTIRALLNQLSTRAEDPIPGLYVKSLKSSQQSIKERNVSAIFTHARAMAPCVLIFEDLDSLISNDVRTYFLNEVDGLEQNDGILMIGSTNHLDKLDSAISKRPSRFDRKYKFGLPGPNERRLYVQHWQKKLTASRRLTFDEAATNFAVKVSEGFSFAYMKELFITSLLVTVGDSADQIETNLDQDAGTKTDASGKDSFEVAMPEELQGNKFMLALFKQSKVLRREMSSVDETDEGKKEDESKK